MSTSTEAKVTSSGQISLPASLRRRWDVGRVLVIDLGGYAIVRPLPVDPIAALRGSCTGDGPTSDEARAAERATDVQRPRRGGSE